MTFVMLLFHPVHWYIIVRNIRDIRKRYKIKKEFDQDIQRIILATNEFIVNNGGYY